MPAGIFPLFATRSLRYLLSVPISPSELTVNKLILSAVTGTLLAAPLAARPQQPPIIDRALFFGEIQIAGAQISPDGQYISFL
jgi:hypothetical protein